MDDRTAILRFLSRGMVGTGEFWVYCWYRVELWSLLGLCWVCGMPTKPSEVMPEYILLKGLLGSSFASACCESTPVDGTAWVTIVGLDSYSCVPVDWFLPNLAKKCLLLGEASIRAILILSCSLLLMVVISFASMWVSVLSLTASWVPVFLN